MNRRHFLKSLLGGTAAVAAGIQSSSATVSNVVNDIAGLDANGKIDPAQLPSFVDDVLEYADQASFPATGESGKIYVALDTKKSYRWGGSAYTKLGLSRAVDFST